MTATTRTLEFCEHHRNAIERQYLGSVLTHVPMNTVISAISDGTSLQLTYLSCPNPSTLKVEWDEEEGQLEVHATYRAIVRVFCNIRDFVVLPSTGGTFEFTASLSESLRRGHEVSYRFHVDLMNRAMYKILS